MDPCSDETLIEAGEQPDWMLLEEIAKRNAAAFEALYERHARALYPTVKRIVRDAGAADEVLQEVFYQVWQKADDYRGTGPAGAWLYRIARNKSLDYLRRQRVRPQPIATVSEASDNALWARVGADELADIEQATERMAICQEVRQALDTIMVEQRLCLELAYFEEMSHRRIASMTATPLGTVKTRIHWGLKKMERLLRAAGY
jgi:RNA polymerase sigma-70 factor, ECF subfamily